MNNIYVDYNYYSNVYQGEVPNDKFNQLEIKASGILNYYTFSRIENIDENVKLAICELVDNLYEIEQADTKGVQSEKVGSYSVTYSSIHKKELKQEQKGIILKYLGHTGLLYRGG